MQKLEPLSLSDMLLMLLQRMQKLEPVSLSDTESVTSIITTDIRKYAKAVKQKLKDFSESEYELSDLDFKVSEKRKVDKNTPIKNKIHPGFKQSMASKSKKSKMKNSSPPKPKSKEFIPSDSSDSETDGSDDRVPTKGVNPVQTSRKRDHSISSSSILSLHLSDCDSESTQASSKKKKGNERNVVNVKTFKRSEDLDMEVSDNDSDVSSVVSSIISDIVEPVKTVTTEPSKPLHDSKTSSPKKKSVEVAQGTSGKATGKDKWKFQHPEKFIMNTTDSSLKLKDIKGHHVYVITMPADLDVSHLNGLNINMNGTSNINVDTEQKEKQYEVTAQKYPTEMKKFNCLLQSDEDNYTLGTQVTGHIEVLPWIPLPPPVVLNKTKPKKHTVPDDLPYKLRPFGADSPPRTHNICEDSIIEDKTHKHKKKKKHKSKS
ncbi:hypothetical protein ACF0H5_015125 [Mactra antiquata]